MSGAVGEVESRCSDGRGELGDREQLLQNDLLLRMGFMHMEVSRVTCSRLLPLCMHGSIKVHLLQRGWSEARLSSAPEGNAPIASSVPGAVGWGGVGWEAGRGWRPCMRRTGTGLYLEESQGRAGFPAFVK